ncbi:hypothetical protein A0H81_01631 [Grifola frondosa]|uniref:Uncharacterized protein n=1 Tax=Grifola frondosa TaxID=5627 RepID=A0A1C7MM82_GRIFR|nr:hypothetical protein A0H81_01631 [Grifola frondosa]
MSLPQATKDIGDHPAAGSVVDPVNKKEQAADVDRKLRFYGVVTALRESRMPSNAQIDETLSYVLSHSPVDTKDLSHDGQKLIQDTRDIIETARLIVEQKNADELFQNFVWHTREADLSSAKKGTNEVIPVDKEKTSSDGQQAVQHLRTLLSLVLTNAEVRKLLADFSVIGRDLLARGASKLADAARPDEERLRSVNDSAPNDQFITEGGRVAGPDETPVLEARVPGTDTTIAQHPHEEIGHGATVKHGNGEVKSGEQAINEGQQRKDELVDRGKMEAQRQKDDVHNRVGEDVVPEDSGDAEAKKQGIMDKIRGVRDNLTDRVPQGHKDRANEHYDRAKHFFSEEYFPEERRDQFIYRGKKVIIECQKHKDYQESSNGCSTSLRSTLRTERRLLDTAKTRISGQRPIRRYNTRRASCEHYLSALQMQDEELRNWFRSVDAYTRRVLLDVLQEMFQRNKSDAESVKSKADDKHAHFKVVSRRDSAILPQVGHPAGWVKRTQEREDAALRGQDWRSDAFSIV